MPSKSRAPAVADKAEVAQPARTRSNDARSLRSQEALQNALLRLIERQPFAKITLREITMEAGVSYPTVFNHYDSKEDLFQEIARIEIVGLLQAFRENRLSPGWRPGEGICAHVVSRRGLWRTLLTTGATEVMRSEFIRRAREIPHSGAGPRHDFPLDVVSGVIASGIFEIAAWWLTQEDDYPLTNVTSMLETLVIEPALGLPPGYFSDRERVAQASQ